MSEPDKTGNVKPSVLWSAVRIAFAIAAVVVIAANLQYRDLLIGENEQSEESVVVLEKSQSAFHVLGPAETIDLFTIITRPAADETTYVLKTPDGEQREYKYQPGAITLAKGVSPVPTFAAIAMFAAVPVLVAWRWRILLDAQTITVRFVHVLKLTYTGLLLNFVLIGTTGGDLVKAYWLGKSTARRADVFVSVFVDRFVGLAFIILFACVLIAAMWTDPQIVRWAKPVGLLLAVLSGAVLILFSSRLRRWTRFERWSPRLPLSSIITKIDRSLMAYRRRPGAILAALAVTLVLQLLASSSTWYLGRALQIDAPIWYYWLYVPLAFLVASIPVSAFWGVGLLEGAYVVLFAGTGLASATQSAMLAMAFRAVQLIWALPGSFILIKGIAEQNGDDE